MSYRPFLTDQKSRYVTSFPQHSKGYKFTNIGQDPKRGYLGLYEYPKKVLKFYGQYQKYKKYTPYYYQDYLSARAKFETNRYVLYDRFRKLYHGKAFPKSRVTRYEPKKRYTKLQKGIKSSSYFQRKCKRFGFQSDKWCRQYSSRPNRRYRRRRTYW